MRHVRLATTISAERVRVQTDLARRLPCSTKSIIPISPAMNVNCSARHRTITAASMMPPAGITPTPTRRTAMSARSGRRTSCRRRPLLRSEPVVHDRTRGEAMEQVRSLAFRLSGLGSCLRRRRPCAGASRDTCGRAPGRLAGGSALHAVVAARSTAWPAGLSGRRRLAGGRGGCAARR